MKGLVERCVKVSCRQATDEELETTHEKEHVAVIRELAKDAEEKSKKKESGLLSPEKVTEEQEPFYFFPSDLPQDTYYNKHSSFLAELAVGGLIDLAVEVMEERVNNGVAIIRPPGHHAECHKMMGFCLYNNVAVAANVIQKKYKNKILIVDWDVHHGNGTQNIFYNSEKVLYFSIHRSDNGDFYPGTGMVEEFGAENGLGFNVNVPLPGPNLGDHEYIAVWEKILLPIARQFKPDLVFVSAGFDAALGDPLGKMEVTPACYAYMTRSLLEATNGKLIIVLEGGYNLTAISASMKMCVHALLGDSVSAPFLDYPTISRATNRKKIFLKAFNDLLVSVLTKQSVYWNLGASLEKEMESLSLLDKSEEK